ncbi:MAG: phosphate ABC transporter substrate-binding protein [Caldilineaceae bacterium]
MRLLVLLCLFCICLSAGCAQSTVATPQPVLIRIAGANSMRPVLLALTEEFSRRYANVVFDLRGGGSTLGQQDVAAGKIDLGASILAPPAAGEPIAPAQSNLVRTPIGIDGLAIVVHHTNKLEGLTLTQLRDIFDGKILNWQEVNGIDGDIQLVSREDGSGARILFEERVMGPEQVSLTAIVMPTSADVVDFVGKNPLAIGYVSRSFVAAQLVDNATDSAQTLVAQSAPVQAGDAAGASVRVLALDGELPYVDKLAAQQYQLVYPIFLVSKSAPKGWLARFVDFVLSPGGQDIVRQFSAPVR